VSNDGKNKFFSFDNSIHQTLAEFNKVSLLGKREIKILFDILDRNWKNEGYESSSEERKFKVRAYRMLLNYFNRPLDVGSDILIVDKVITGRFNKRLILYSKVDKVYEKYDGDIEVIDYKSGYVINHNNDFEISLKSAVLLQVVTHKLGTYPNYLSYYYLSYNQKFTRKISEADLYKSYQMISKKLW
jgi:hypothetical protein